MPRRFFVSALLTRIRQVTDTESDDHITDAFLQTHLATIYGALWGAVCETGYRYFETRASLVSDGSNVLPEPAALFAHVGLDFIDPSGIRYELYEIMAQERTTVAQPWVTGTRPRYFELIDDEFRIYPTPPSGSNFELLYIPQPPDLTDAAPTDLVDVVTPDGEAFLTYGVSLLVNARKEQDPALMTAEREAARQRLVDWASMRAFHQPRRQVVQSSDWDCPTPGDWWWAR